MDKELIARATWSIISEGYDTATTVFVNTTGHTAALNLAGYEDALADGIAATGLVTKEEAAHRARAIRTRFRPAAIDAALGATFREGIHMIDPTTVPQIARLGHTAPHLLWLKGDPDALHAPAVTISGARAATDRGVRLAEQTAEALTRAGHTIHSGLAYGIDGAAHRAALAADGHTVAWTAGSVTRAYPIGHTDLMDRILRTTGSAVISEVPPIGASPTRARFIARCRLLATADATILIEAGTRSGSLTIAHNAAALHLPVYAYPGPDDAAASTGTNTLIHDGIATPITTPDEITAALAA